MTGFLDIRNAATFLSRSPRWIRARLSEIPHYRPPGGQILFAEDDLRKWLAKFKVDPKPINLTAVLERVGVAKRRQRSKES